MGKRKNRHCRSKREVILRELEKRQQAAGRQETKAKQMMRTINSAKPTMEQARKHMRDKNRRESKHDE